jgi:hypothetical protein
VSKDADEKTWFPQPHSDGTTRSYSQSAGPVAGGKPIISVGGIAAAVAIAISSLPVDGRTFVEDEVERSPNGSSGWVILNAHRQAAASTLPARSTAVATKIVNPALSPSGSIFPTLKAAFATANPGDVIDVAPGDYSEEEIILSRGGTLAQPVMVRAADPANKPRIRGLGTLPRGWNETGGVAGSSALVTIAASHVVWDGIDIEGSRVHGMIVGPANNNGSFIANNAQWFSNVKVLRTRITGCDGDCFKAMQTDGVMFNGVALDAQRTKFQENGLISGFGSAITLMGKNITLLEAVIGQTSGEGVHCGHHISYGAGAFIQVEGLFMKRCVFFDTWSAPVYFTNVDGGLVEQCLVYHTTDTRNYWGRIYPQYGLDFGSESFVTDPAYNAAPDSLGRGGCRNLTVRNCVVANAVFPVRFAIWPGQLYSNIQIYHNTFLNAFDGGGVAGISSVIKNEMTNLTGVTWKCNLVADSTPAQVCRQWNAMLGSVQLGTNLYSATPAAAILGVTDIINSNVGLTNQGYVRTGAYPSYSPYDTDSFRLVPGSPAVNAGELLAGAPDDFFGYDRPTTSGKSDIGAHSLSRPNNLVLLDTTGLPPSNSYWYRVRRRDNTLAWTPKSDAVQVTV